MKVQTRNSVATGYADDEECASVNREVHDAALDRDEAR
jgi:hypothetical protein